MPSQPQHIFSVSELNQYAKETLESTFPSVWIEAEVSNLVQPSSGHIYLTLKDKSAQIRAAMFKGRNQRLNFRPQNGDQVLVKGRLSLYAPRGDYQLIIDSMEEAGLGALQKAFEALKAKLAKEGLFEDSLKRPLPAHPKCVGVVTSSTGAAVQDIISVLKRRFPLLPIIVYPCAVQGEEAPQQIISAINKANERNECDVLIVGRGGGSLEDLWAFNNETLARTIRNSTIPIVSAVGHQIDFTIADFVSDLRAPTPSAAAELLSQDQQELLGYFAGYEKVFFDKISQSIMQSGQQLTWLSKRLKHPGQKLQEQQQRLDMLEARLQSNKDRKLEQQQQKLAYLAQRLNVQSPATKIQFNLEKINEFQHRIIQLMETQKENRQQRLGFLAQQLNTISPLATLSRGYAIVKTDEDEIIRSTDAVKTGDQVKTKLANGTLLCSVTDISAE